MAGEGVPQHVRVQMLAQFTNSGLAHAQLDGPRGEAASLLADEHRLVAGVGHGAQGQPFLQRFAGLAAHRQFAGLVALAEHAYQAGGEIEAIDVQPHQLGEAQARGVEEFQHGLVATGEEVVFHGAVQQLLGAVGVQRPGQAAGALGRGEAVGRVVAAAAFADQVLVEAAHRREQAGQAAAGQAILVQPRDEAAQAAHVQIIPVIDAEFLAECAHLQQVPVVPVQGVGRDLALAAQVVQVGIQVGLHGTSLGCAVCAYLTERSGVAKRGSTRARTSAI
ncbi:hypothetical protein D9M70_271440 [compost metagenome]